MAMSAALPAALQSYLSTCTSEHAEQIIQALRSSQAQNAQKQTPDAAFAMKGTTDLVTTKTGKKNRSKNTKRVAATGGPKRPLNSWMAFRKYYSASLSPHTQKVISKILMAWWKADPFEAKWALLAKAYSTLRGSREKDEAPLDEFFVLSAPLIGVIPPNQYQQLMGWTLILPVATDEEQVPQVQRVFVPSIDTFPEKFTITNLSVNDLVEHCMAKGYLASNKANLIDSDGKGALTMAVQPSSTTYFDTMGPATAGESILNSDMGIVEDGSVPIPLSPWSYEFAQNLTNVIAAEAVEPAGRIALNDATVAISNADVYPYNDLFDPTSQFDISFDPATSNDSVADAGIWDAYDLAANAVVDEVNWAQYINNESMF